MIYLLAIYVASHVGYFGFIVWRDLAEIKRRKLVCQINQDVNSKVMAADKSSGEALNNLVKEFAEFRKQFGR